MTDLIKAEFLRLVSRRLTAILVLLAVLLAAFISISTSNTARPVGESDWELARQTHAAQKELYESECGMYDTGCDTGFPGEPADYLRVPVNYDDYMSGSLYTSLFVLIAATVLAAAVVGSEFTSGSLSTQLTFTPRRLHVMAAKVTAATTGAVALMLLYVVTTFVLGTLAFVMLRGAGDVAAEPYLGMQVLRLLVTTFFVAALASSLTFGLGSSVLSIAAGALFLIASELTMLNVESPPLWLARLLPSPNLVALIEETYEYMIWDQDLLVATHTIDFGDAVLYATVLVLVVATVSALVFRRRDLLR